MAVHAGDERRVSGQVPKDSLLEREVTRLIPAQTRTDRTFIWVAIAFLAYAGVYIARMTFLVDGVRYFTLADDQMISMRYAENLASGFGLVWNRGEVPIEGYTNFLWVVYMALFHLAHIPRPWISGCIQVSGAIFLLANLFVTKKLADILAGEQVGAGMLAAVLTAFYIPLDNWAFQGTEVSVMALIVTLVAFLAVKGGGEGPSLRAWLLAAAATLVRPDAAVIAAAMALGVVIVRPSSWRRNLCLGVGVVAVALIAQTAFRLWYFGDSLPNTYYLKVTGIPGWLRTSRGAVVTLVFLLQISPVVFLIALSARSRLWRGRHAYLLCIFGMQLAYNVSVGGDAWEWWGGSNRFMAIVMPIFFVMAATALSGMLYRHSWSLSIGGCTAVGVIALNMLAFSTSPAPVWRRILLVDRPFENESDAQMVRAALAIRRTTDPSAVVAVTWAGAIPYFSEHPAIDLLGKMDRHIAREPMHMPTGKYPWLQFIPGHLKWDYSYSIGGLKPDIIQAPLWTVPEVAHNDEPPLAGQYTRKTAVIDWYFRNDSSYVNASAVALK
jgi:hypothetical protein